MLSNRTLKNLACWLDHQSSVRLLWLAIALAVLCQLAMSPLDQRLHLISGGLGKPSLVFGASAADLLQRLQVFGAQGRQILTRLYMIDFVFPTALALAAIQGNWLAFGRVAPTLALGLAAVAIGFDVLDLLEKLSSLWIIADFPRHAPGWASFTVTVTSVKLLLLGVIYVSLLAGLLRWGWQSWRARRR